MLKRQSYPEFDRLRAELERKQQPHWDVISNVHARRQDLLNNSFVYRLFQAICRFCFLLVILAALLAYSQSIAAAIAAAIAMALLTGYCSFSTNRFEEFILSHAGTTWADLLAKQQQAHDAIDQTAKQYESEYERLCISCHSYPPDWIKRRAFVLRRDGYQCTKCHYPVGFKRRSRELHVHHKRSLRKGGDNSLDNLTTLCHICHRSNDPDHAGVRKLKSHSRRR